MKLIKMKKFIICAVVLISIGLVFYGIRQRQKYLNNNSVRYHYKIIEKDFQEKKCDYDLIIRYLQEKQLEHLAMDEHQELIEIYIEASDLKSNIELELDEFLEHFDASDYRWSITATYRWSITGYQLVVVDFPLKNEKTSNMEFWIKWKDTSYEDQLSDDTLHKIEDKWYIMLWGFGY